MLHTMTPDPAQLRHWVDEIIPATSGSRPTAGPVPRGWRRWRAVTRRVALLGKPLRRRHSQVMHDAAFAAAGIDARYELLRARGGRRSKPPSPRRAAPTGSGSG